MNRKKYFLGSTLLLCGALTACSFAPFAPKVENNTTEALDELKGDGILALDNNDTEDSVLATSKDGRFTYRTNNINGVTIVSDGVQATGELTIPDTIDGHKVTKIGCAAYANSQVTKIIIPDGIKLIDEMAFSGCHSLKEVVFGSDIVVVRNGAFMDCYSLTSVKLNDGLYSLGHSVFSACYDLKEIAIPNSVELIDKYCFTNSGLTEITLPEKLYYVAEGTFMGCMDLKKVKLPTTLAIIDHLAFADCPKVEMEIADTCKQVCKTAFQNSAVVVVPAEAWFDPKTLTYEGDFSEFENPQIVKYFYANTEKESTSK
jgi:hypothetical protein